MIFRLKGILAATLDSPFPWIADKTSFPNIPGEPEPALVPIAYGTFDSRDGTVPAVRIGNLLASTPIELYVSGRTSNQLYRVNVVDPSDDTGVFGAVGAFPAGLTKSIGLAFDENADLLCASGSNEGLWKLNTANPSDETGGYGHLGAFPSGAGDPSAIAVSSGGAVYTVLSTNTSKYAIWRINPADPSDESGDFGFVGRVSYLDDLFQLSPQGLAFNGSDELYLVVGGREIVKVNPADPSDESGDFGVVGMLPTYARAPFGLAFDPNDTAYVTKAGGTPITRELVRVNIADPSDESGDFGVVGPFQMELFAPFGIAFSGPHTNEWIASIGTATPTSAWYTDRSTGDPVELGMSQVENKAYNGTDLTSFRLDRNPGVEVRWNGQGIDLDSPADQWKDLLEKLDIDVDDDSFAAAKTALSGQSVSGNIVVSSLRETLRSVSRDIGRSFGMESYIARSGAVGVSVAVPAVTPVSPVSITEADVLAGSMSMQHPGYYLTGINYQFAPQFGSSGRTYLEQNTVRDAAELLVQGRESLETLQMPYQRDSASAEIVVNARLFFASEERVLTKLAVSADVVRTLTIGSVIRLTHSLGIGTDGWDAQAMRIVSFGIEVDRTRLAGRLQLIDIDDTP